MSTITTINSGDNISDSRSVINTNFSNLNTDKIETSTLDTDTTMAANSDSKIPTQKAVKAYVDTQGGANASTTVRGIVEEATDAEVNAGTTSGATGARLYVNPASLKNSTSPVTTVYSTSPTEMGGSTTQFDITNPSGTTFRYTFDGTGTDPSISAANLPVNTIVNIQAQNFTAGNNGIFIVTASGTNYFEVTNASGVAETNKTIGTGYIVRGVLWTKPTGLKYVVAEVIGGGGGGGGSDADGEVGAGGGGGGYSRKVIAAASLSSTVGVLVGSGGAGSSGVGAGSGTTGRTSSFGALLQATGGVGGVNSNGNAGAAGGNAGVGSSGDLNTEGEDGQSAVANSSVGSIGGHGGNSYLGGGGKAGVMSGGAGANGNSYGGGGGGATSSDATAYAGGTGANGAVIITEHYF